MEWLLAEGKEYYVILYAAAYLAGMFAFSSSSMYRLRLFVVISSTAFAVYYLLYPKEPLWIDVAAESLVVCINVIMLIHLWHQSRSSRFTAEEKEVYNAFFTGFSPFEFFKLMSIAEWKNYVPGEIMTEQGQYVENIYFIYDGKAVVIQDGKNVAMVSAGRFVGEISYKLKTPANAMVVVSEPCRAVVWPQDKLHDLLVRNQSMGRVFESMISVDLARKLGPKKS